MTGRDFDELRTISLNLNLAYGTKDWEMVDRQLFRLTSLIMEVWPDVSTDS